MTRPNRLPIATILTSALVVAGCGPYLVDGEPDASGWGETPDAGAVPDAGSEPTTEPPVGMGAPPNNVAKPDATCSNGRKVIVKQAVDGDTVELTVTKAGRNERVRLIDVNTPESFPENEKQCFGDAAKDHTHAVLDGVHACLTFDPAVTRESDDVDMYGRTLAYLWFGEGYARFYNAELVYLGFARTLFYTDGTLYEPYLRSLQTNARNAGRGLWTACQ